MKKWIISIVVFIISFTLTILIGFYAAIFLIGPHSDILPEILQVPVGIILLIVTIGIPVWFGRKTFYHFGIKEKK